MTAVATTQIQVKDLAEDYEVTGSEVDADGEEDADVDYSAAQTPAENAINQTGEEAESVENEARAEDENEEDENEDDNLESASESEEQGDQDVDGDEETGQADEDEDDEEEDDDEHGSETVGAVKMPKDEELESDEEVVGDDFSDEDGASDEERIVASSGSSSSASSEAPEEWEVTSVNGNERDADVANRNNCMLVMLMHSSIAILIFQQFLRPR